MIEKFKQILNHEQKILAELVVLADMQQNALLNYKTKLLEAVAIKQDKLSIMLKQLEEERIKLLMTWLGLSRKDATNLRLSTIEKNLKEKDMIEVKAIRSNMKKLHQDLLNANNTNKLLANRAMQGVQNIMAHFTSGVNHVCNVQV